MRRQRMLERIADDMKRCRFLRLTLLGSAVLAFAGCDQAPARPASFFPDVRACAKVHTVTACRAAQALAQAMFGAYVPGHATMKECEAVFGPGNCEAPFAGQPGSSFVPMVMGFMTDREPAAPVYRGPDDQALMPSRGKLYRVGRFVGAGRAAGFQPEPIREVPGLD